MNFFRRVTARINYELSKFRSPTMIGGFRVSDGKFLKHTRISNSTYIGCKGKLKIDDHVFIGHFNFIDACNGITIGEGCQITNYVSILTHSSHNSIRYYGKHYVKEKELLGYVKGSVEIGAYTFIGPHVIVMPGTKIGKGCIISAFSYVKGEFPDFAIIAGNPATIVGDTKIADEEFLNQHPELRAHYDGWAG